MSATNLVSDAPLRVGTLRLPSGRSLPQDAWRRRHRGVLALLFAHVAGLAAFGVYMGAGWSHSLLEASLVAGIALVALQPWIARRLRSIIASFGLMTCSAILVHLSGGYIEAHFHFFVMLGVIFLYEDWLPYVLSVGFVAIHHGVMGTIDPRSVFNHPAALSDPWDFAAIHALFILGLSAALLVAWNVIELARSAESLARMRTEELTRQLQAQEKMAALGSLVAGLAHEVRTPLAVVSSSASIIERTAKRDMPEVAASRVLNQVDEIQASVDRINALVLQLRKFHATPSDQTRVTTLSGVVKDAVRLFALVNKAAPTVEAEYRDTSLVRIDALGIHQIVLNLLANAAEATRAGGRITLRTRDEDGWSVLEIADDGHGMDEATLAKAFDPLFTTKKDGMGLGLHIVKRIVDAHGGAIRCESAPGHGSTFLIRLRAERPSPAPAPPIDAPAAAVQVRAAT